MFQFYILLYWIDGIHFCLYFKESGSLWNFVFDYCQNQNSKATPYVQIMHIYIFERKIHL